MTTLPLASRRLLVAAACMLAACGAPTPPNIIVIVGDTLRADRLGSYGNPRGLTPFIDSIAERGTVFRSAYAQSSWTNPDPGERNPNALDESERAVLRQTLEEMHQRAAHRDAKRENKPVDDATREQIRALRYDR